MTQAIEPKGEYHPGLSMTAKEAEAQADAILDQYAGWATALMRVVEAKELYVMIGKKKYLEFEAWQLIGTFDRAFVDTNDVTPFEHDGEVTGYICHAKIIRDGIHAGGATQFCGLEAFPCRGKEGSAKDNAAISAAQTWAGSKALKMRYSAVAVLGGYEVATAEEMHRAQEEMPDKTQHYCETHQANWFKRGRMRTFAHRIEGTDQWCNEPTVSSNPPPVSLPSVGTCPIHNVRLGRDSAKRWCHKLQDGTFCYGIATQEQEETTDRDSQLGPINPDGSSEDFPDTPLGELQREVSEAEMDWADFENQVLKMPWTEWLKLNGTVISAHARLVEWNTK